MPPGFTLTNSGAYADMMTRSEFRSMLVIQAASPKAALMLGVGAPTRVAHSPTDRKSTRLNSSHLGISYAVFCLKKKKNKGHVYGRQLPVQRLRELVPARSSS